MVVGVLQVELHVPNARSLKDRRSVVKSLRDQMRSRFNIAVAEVASTEKWQRATLGISTVGEDRPYVEGLLRQVTEWLRQTCLVALITVQEEYF